MLLGTPTVGGVRDPWIYAYNGCGDPGAWAKTTIMVYEAPAFTAATPPDGFSG